MSYLYNNDGKLVSRTDARNTVTTNLYDALIKLQLGRQSHWSERFAVGSSVYVEALKKQSGPSANGRDILAVEGTH